MHKAEGTVAESGTDQGAGDDRDTIDVIVAQMMRVRPDSDLRSLHLVSRMLRIVRIFERDREQALKPHGLEPWSFDMLAAIRRTPGMRVRPSDLIEATLVTSGTMTTRLKSLERRGLIVREHDDVDRRGVIVSLTPAGIATIDSTFEDVLACQRAIIAELDEEEKGRLEALLRVILRRHDDNSIFH